MSGGSNMRRNRAYDSSPGGAMSNQKSRSSLPPVSKAVFKSDTEQGIRQASPNSGVRLNPIQKKNAGGNLGDPFEF